MSAKSNDAQELIVNPSFESGDTSPNGWKTYAGAKFGDYTWEGHGYDGDMCVSVSGRLNEYHGGWMQVVNLAPNKLYRIRGYAKGAVTAGRAVVCMLEVEDAKGRFYSFPAGTLTGTRNWRLYEGYAVCPSTLKSATFYAILLYGAGKVSADKVSLKMVEPFVVAKGENAVIGMQGALFRFTPDGSIVVWGDGVNGARLNFSARLGEKNWLTANGFKSLSVTADTDERKAISVCYQLVERHTKRPRRDCYLRCTVEAKLVDDIPCLLVHSELLNIGVAPINAYMFYHLRAVAVILPSGQRIPLNKWGGLTRATCYIIELRGREDKRAPYRMGMIPVGSIIDRGPKHINVFAPQFKMTLKRKQALSLKYAIAITSDMEQLRKVKNSPMK
ncbi:MAG TPA: hypothetical protein EYP10_09000 [Armatimonadetes bacterium]|nr:hypothetical protein [Armatimonadota bacterium]